MASAPAADARLHDRICDCVAAFDTRRVRQARPRARGARLAPSSACVAPALAVIDGALWRSLGEGGGFFDPAQGFCKIGSGLLGSFSAEQIIDGFLH